MQAVRSDPLRIAGSKLAIADKDREERAIADDNGDDRHFLERPMKALRIRDREDRWPDSPTSTTPEAIGDADGAQTPVPMDGSQTPVPMPESDDQLNTLIDQEVGL